MTINESKYNTDRLNLIRLNDELNERYGERHEAMHYVGINKNETHVKYIYKGIKRKIQVGYTDNLINNLSQINPPPSKMQSPFDIFSKFKKRALTEV